MNQECSGNASTSTSTLIPSVDLDVRCVQNVLSEDNIIRACPHSFLSVLVTLVTVLESRL